MHKSMKAKLDAFLSAPSQVLAQYKPDDNSVPARYARAIAYYRIPSSTRRCQLIDGLIKDEPNNPYFEELKGQMLFENGHVKEAVAPYQRAVAPQARQRAAQDRSWRRSSSRPRMRASCRRR